MKVFVDLPAPLDAACRQVLPIVGGEVVSSEEAQLVITDDAGKCMRYLKAGKFVFQFVSGGARAATGLATAPRFKDRFRIVDGVGRGLVDIARFAQELGLMEAR